MKYVYLSLLLFVSTVFWAQKEMPRVTLKSLEAKDFNLSESFAEQDKVYVFAFWATWCVPCINELDAIRNNYAEWQQELDFEVIAISIDDSKTAKRVKPLVNGRNWPYTILLDSNQEAKRLMGVANVPYTVVVKNKKIVYIHNGYNQGNEQALFDKIKTF